MAKDRRNPSNNSDSKTQSSAAVILQALAAKATGGLVRKPEGDTSSGIVGAITAIGTKLLALIGPIALLGLSISSSVSGFQPLLASLKLVGSLLGAFLAPIFITFAAAITTVVDLFEADLLEAIKTFAQFIFTNAIDAVAGLEKAIFNAAYGVSYFAVELYKAIKQIGFIIDAIQGKQSNTTIDPIGRVLIDNLNKSEKAVNKGGTLDEILGIFKTGLNVGKLKEGDIANTFKGNLQGAIEELRRANSPQAESNDLIGAARKAQLAALNQSPYEAKMLDLNQKILGALQDALNGALKPAVVK